MIIHLKSQQIARIRKVAYRVFIKLYEIQITYNIKVKRLMGSWNIKLFLNSLQRCDEICLREKENTRFIYSSFSWKVFLTHVSLGRSRQWKDAWWRLVILTSGKSSKLCSAHPSHPPSLPHVVFLGQPRAPGAVDGTGCPRLGYTDWFPRTLGWIPKESRSPFVFDSLVN